MRTSRWSQAPEYEAQIELFVLLHPFGKSNSAELRMLVQKSL
jgi:hypothetical protein